MKEKIMNIRGNSISALRIAVAWRKFMCTCILLGERVSVSPPNESILELFLNTT